MRKSGLVPALIFFVFCPLLTSAQFRYYTTENGLPSNTINALYQDSQGFVWAGTAFGLCRNNGLEFNKYDLTVGQISNKNVYAICELPLKNELWIGSSEGLFALDMQNMTFRKVSIVTDDNSEKDASVYRLKADSNGNIWVGSYGNGLFRYNTQSELWESYEDTFGKVIISDILITSDQVVWAICSDKNIYRYNAGRNEFNAIPIMDKFTRRSIGHAVCCCQDSYGDIWICDDNADLYRLDLTDMLCVASKLQTSEEKILARIIIEYKTGELIIGTNTGILSFDTAQRKYHWIDRGERQYNGKLNDKFIHALVKDRDDGLWVGTYFGGINYRSFNTSIVNSIYPPTGCGSIISIMSEMSDGRVLIGSDDGGLSIYNPYDGSYTKKVIDHENQNLNIHAILVDYNNIWIGTFSNGLYRLNEKLNTTRHYDSNDVTSGDMNVYSALRDSYDRLWIGTKQGICRYDEPGDQFIRVLALGRNSDVTKIIQKNDVIYFASQGEGLISFNATTEEFNIHINTQANAPKHVSSLDIYNDILYIGSSEGLYYLNPDEIIEKCSEPLLSDCSVSSLTADYSGLWLTTNHGLICYDAKGNLQQFTSEDGFMSESFNINSSVKLSSGEMLIGTDRGINSLRPSTLKNSIKPRNLKVVITDFNEIGKNGKRNRRSIVNDIVLRNKNACFTIDFVALNYQSQSKNCYRYRLSGYEDSWNYLTRDRLFRDIVYTDIRPGKYKFEVCAAQSSTNEFGNITTLEINVIRPIKNMILILTGYLFSILIVLFTIITFVRNMKLRYDLNARRRSTVYHTLFQNILEGILREVRSTLQLVTISSRMNNSYNLPVALKSDFAILENNINRLNNYIDNKTLEYTLLADSGNSNDIEQKSDMYWVIYAVCEKYRDIALDYYGKEMSIYISENAKLINTKIEIKTLLNVLTRIIESTIDQAGKHIYVNLDAIDKMFTVRISRDGKEKSFSVDKILKHIKDKNIRIVEVPCEQGETTAVEVRVPFSQIQPEDTSEKIFSEDEQEQFEEKAYNVIIMDSFVILGKKLFQIEDNTFNIVQSSMHMNIANALDNFPVCAIVCSAETQSGFETEYWQSIREKHPEIILLYICSSLTDADKIAYLRSGVDFCVAQPASLELIINQINSLMRFREHENIENPKANTHHSLLETCRHDPFTSQVCDIINKNISNPALGVNDISKEMNVSRATVFNKIKSTLNTTPNMLIHILRLEKAAQLLRNPNVRISEVYYTIGFTSGSYFSKLFRKEFGMTPKEYTKLK